MRFALILTLITALAGCSTPPEEVVGEPPPAEQAYVPQRSMNIKLGKEQPKRKSDQPEAILTIAGWPYNEADATFSLTWGAKRTTLGLFDEPTLNGQVIDKLSLENGKEIFWTDTAVAVFEPSTWQVKAPVTVEGYKWSEGYRTGGDLHSVDLNPGDSIKLFHYSGQGLCIMSVRGVRVEALCPSEEKYRGNFEAPMRAAIYQPRESLWWVRMRSANGGGWFPLDDRVIVDVQN